jgi:hypothetical protein
MQSLFRVPKGKSFFSETLSSLARQTKWALAFLRRFCQLKYPAIASSDSVIRVFSRVGL